MPLKKQIFAIAIPAIVANITTPLLSLADMAIVGHLGSDLYIAAIALGGTIFSSIYWMFGFLRMGTSGMVAQGYGAHNTNAISLNYFRPICVAMAFGALIVVAGNLFRDQLIEFLADDDSAVPLTRDYFDILIFGAPATLAIYVINGFLIGMQNTRAVMWLSLCINIGNIIASFLLVYVANLDIKGAAAGTLIAQCSGMIAGVVYIATRYKLKWLGLKSLLEITGIKRFFSINTDIFLRTVCLVGVTTWFTRAGASQSVVILSANALMMQLFMLFSYFMDGMAYAAEALVGQSIGASYPSHASKAVRAIMKISVIISITFSIIYIIGGESILSLLTSDAATIETAGNFIVWAAAIPLVSVAAFVIDGAFIGATATRQMLIAVAVAAIVFIIVYLISIDSLGNNALWLSFVLYLSTRSAISIFIARKRKLL